jgi:hypothetical protein
VKNHDFTPKKSYFSPIAEGGAKIFGVLRVKNHDFTPKNHIFPILGGGARNFWGISKTTLITPKNRNTDGQFNISETSKS